MLEDNVHTTIVGEAAHFLADAHDAVLDDVVGAELLCLGELFIRARRCNHAAAEEFRDLDRGAADSASSAEDQNIFAGLELRACHEHVPGCLKNQRHSRRLLETEIFRIRHAIYFRAADIFGAASVNHVAEIGKFTAAVVRARKAGGAFAAGNARREDDLLPDVNSRHVFADLRHFSGDVAPGNVRQRDGYVGEAAAHPEIQVIQRAGAHADKHFI